MELHLQNTLFAFAFAMAMVAYRICILTSWLSLALHAPLRFLSPYPPWSQIRIAQNIFTFWSSP